MRFFRSIMESVVAPVVTAKAPPTRPNLSFEGLSERDMISLHPASVTKTYRLGETIFQNPDNRSFWIVAEGVVQVSVETPDGRSRSATYTKGDCISPMRGVTDLHHVAECLEPSTVIEIKPAALPLLPEKTQLWIHQTANRSSSRVQREALLCGIESERRNGLFTVYIQNDLAKTRSIVNSDFVQGFIARTPRLPAFAMDLAAKLLDERTTVQQVTESVKRDPSLAATLLKTVNSSLYGFGRQIENFDHACVLLGFNNIYQLVLRDALGHVMPNTTENKRMHAHSCMISALCYETAMATGGKVHPQTATTYGLLHEIGNSVIWLMQAENPVAKEFISLLDNAMIGSDLLQRWGLPDRLCRVVEFQRYPDFAAPNMIQSDFCPDLAILNLAHLFEKLIQGENLDPSSTIHTAAYMSLLGITNKTPEEFFHQRILPSLSVNKGRYAEEVRSAIVAFEEAAKAAKAAKAPPVFKGQRNF